MRSPLGDHAGCASFSPLRVRRRGADPSQGKSHRAVLPLFSFIE